MLHMVAVPSKGQIQTVLGYLDDLYLIRKVTMTHMIFCAHYNLRTIRTMTLIW